MKDKMEFRFEKQLPLKYLPIAEREGFLLAYASGFASLKEQSTVYHIRHEEARGILKLNYLVNMALFQKEGLIFWNQSLIPRVPGRTTDTCWLKPFNQEEMIAIKPPEELSRKGVNQLNIVPSKRGILLLTNRLYLLRKEGNELVWTELDVEGKDRVQFFLTNSTCPDIILAAEKKKKHYLLYRVTEDGAEIIARLPHVLANIGKHLWIIVPREVFVYPDDTIENAEKLIVSFDSAKTWSRIGIINLKDSNPTWRVLPKPFYTPMTRLNVGGEEGIVYVSGEKRRLFGRISKLSWFNAGEETTIEGKTINGRVSLLRGTASGELVIGTDKGVLSFMQPEAFNM